MPLYQDEQGRLYLPQRLGAWGLARGRRLPVRQLRPGAERQLSGLTPPLVLPPLLLMAGMVPLWLLVGEDAVRLASGLLLIWGAWFMDWQLHRKACEPQRLELPAAAVLVLPQPGSIVLMELLKPWCLTFFFLCQLLPIIERDLVGYGAFLQGLSRGAIAASVASTITLNVCLILSLRRAAGERPLAG